MNDAPHPHATPPASGGDGVRITGRGRSRRPAMYRTLAMLLMLAGLGFVARTFLAHPADARSDAQARSEDDMQDGAPPATRARTHAPATERASPHADIRATRVAADDISQFVSPGQPAPTMREVIERLHKAGVRSGLGAFNPPGTRPPLVGLAVPEDFVLPPGYVRHGQATDDGQRIEPILMFAPDFVLRDASGRTLPLPDNRVVPPELAPPGLPIRLIRIPSPREPGFPTY